MMNNTASSTIDLGSPMLEEDLRINFDELDEQVDFETHM